MSDRLDLIMASAAAHQLATMKSRSKVEGRRSKVRRHHAAIHRLEGVATKPLACFVCLSNDGVISWQRAVWIDVTAAESRDLNSDKHSGGVQEEAQSGLRSILEHRRRLPRRNGVPATSQQRPRSLRTPMRASPRRMRGDSAHAAHIANQSRSRKHLAVLDLRPSTFDLRPTGAIAVLDIP